MDELYSMLILSQLNFKSKQTKTLLGVNSAGQSDYYFFQKFAEINSGMLKSKTLN